MSISSPVVSSIAELSDAIRARRLSSLEATDAMLARIERLNPRFHAFVTVTAERAREDARRADDERARGLIRSPLHGVPIALSDAIDTAGIVTSAGMAIFKDRIPDQDATVARRLKHAGAVLLGKLTTSEGSSAYFHPDAIVPVNPWGSDRWISSSGSGIALATGTAYAALALDPVGSVRLQAATSGQTALRPTFGRISRAGVMPLVPSMDQIGVLGRTAEDCALVLGQIAGHDASDPTTLHAPMPAFSPATGSHISGLRIGFDPAQISDLHPQVISTIEYTLRVLKELGAIICRINLPALDSMLRPWSFLLCAPEAAAVHEEYFGAARHAYGPKLQLTLDAGHALPATELVRLQQLRLEFTTLYRMALETIDAVVLPSIPTPIPSADQAETDFTNPESTARLLDFLAPVNFAGVPALALPAGVDAHGLPIVIQLVSRFLSEDTLLRLGHAFQRATDWHRREPPLG